MSDYFTIGVYGKNRLTFAQFDSAIDVLSFLPRTNAELCSTRETEYKQTTLTIPLDRNAGQKLKILFRMFRHDHHFDLLAAVCSVPFQRGIDFTFARNIIRDSHHLKSHVRYCKPQNLKKSTVVIEGRTAGFFGSDLDFFRHTARRCRSGKIWRAR